MRTAELLRALRKIARQRGLAFAIENRPGKGSHGRVTLGHRRATVPRHADLKRGTLHAILAQLGLSERDLR